MIEQEIGAVVTADWFGAGWLCLDFANTADWHRRETPTEQLTSYDVLVEWGEMAEVLSHEQARRLLHEAERHPDEADAVLKEAIALREAIYRIFSAVNEEKYPDAANLDTLNAALGKAMAHSKIETEVDHFVWGWSGPENALDRMLWPVARSAADLLTSGDLGRVRECADDACGWLFIDTSRNHSRRWCSMEGCGNRAKARRHYRRVRTSQENGS